MAKITFADKVQLNANPDVADVNKGRAVDWNEVKEVVNNNIDFIGTGTDTWSNSSTYSIGDYVIYSNNIYVNLTGSNTTTPPDDDTTNWVAKSLINDYTLNFPAQEVRSTEERVIGTFLNGKPFYQKDFIFQNSNQLYEGGSLSTGLTNLGYAEYDAWIGLNNNAQLGPKTRRISSETWYSLSEIVLSTGVVNVHASSGFSSSTTRNIYLSVKYTKNSD